MTFVVCMEDTRREPVQGRAMQQRRRGIRYQQPEVVDYGTLVELTAASTFSDTEDGVGKVSTPVGTAGHTDGSLPIG